MTPPRTPDGRYIVVRGRLWRMSDPRLDGVDIAVLVPCFNEAAAIENGAVIEALPQPALAPSDPERTRQAIAAWQRDRGLPATRELDGTQISALAPSR